MSEVQGDAEFVESLKADLETAQVEDAASEAAGADDEEVSFLDKEVEVEGGASAEASTSAADETFEQWQERIGGIDLANAPKGLGVPVPRFSQVIHQRNEARTKYQELEARYAELERQAAKPPWVDQLAAQQQQPQVNSDEAWLDSILGTSENAVSPQHIDQVVEQRLNAHPAVQQFQSYLANQEREKQNYHLATQLRAEVQEIQEAYPNVPEQFLYNAYAANQNMLQTAQSLSQLLGQQQGAQAPAANQMHAAPPVIGRAPSRPRTAAPVKTNAMDDDDFLLHMRQTVKQQFGS